MRIGVIEHRLQGNAEDDVAALVEASRLASERGIEALFFPQVLLSAAPGLRDSLGEKLSGLPGTRLIPHVDGSVDAEVFAVTDEIPVIGQRLGKTALVHRDACFDAAVLERVAAAEPDVLVLTPMSESELQAEAVLELAIGLSESVAGLIVIAECVGAEAGDPGHGGSAIILLGKVLAEGLGEDGDLLVAEVPEPIPGPEPPEPIPAVPTILAQRLATHQGRRLDMGYLADLSGGIGPR